MGHPRAYGQGVYTEISPLISFVLWAEHYTLLGEIPSATPPPISSASSDLKVFYSCPLALQLGTQSCHLQTDGLGHAECTVACRL